jgi:hypothetical protein
MVNWTHETKAQQNNSGLRALVALAFQTSQKKAGIVYEGNLTGGGWSSLSRVTTRFQLYFDTAGHQAYFGSGRGQWHLPRHDSMERLEL